MKPAYQTMKEAEAAFSRLAKLEQQQAAKEAKHKAKIQALTDKHAADIDPLANEQAAIRAAGMKPAKVKRSAGRPLAERAAMTLLAPGSGLTRISAACARRVSSAPGSETSGVPASLTRATFSPACRRRIRASAAPRSLCWCSAVSGRSMA